MPRSILENFDTYGKMQPVGVTNHFALSNAKPFSEAYDMTAITVKPSLFSTEFKVKKNEPKREYSEVEQRPYDPLETEPMARYYLGSLTLIGLFIFYKCIMRGL